MRLLKVLEMSFIYQLQSLQIVFGNYSNFFLKVLSNKISIFANNFGPCKTLRFLKVF